MPRVAGSAAVVIASILVLAGCASTTDPSAAPTRSAATSPVASPSVTPTPTPTKSSLAELVLEPGGLGALRIGSPVPDTGPAELAIVHWNPTHCEDVPDYGGAWEPAYPIDPNGAFGETVPFAVGTTDGGRTAPVIAIQTFSPQLRTATGIQVGSTVAELKAAYPAGFATRTHGLYTDTYAVDGPGGRLLFEAYDGSSDAGGLDTVAIISAVRPGTEPYTLIPGDAFYGSCA